MKKYFKDTWYMYVIVFVFCFMLFLYEPLIMFLGNAEDFWFSLSTMFKHTFLLFLFVFLGLAVAFNIVYFFNKSKSKKIFKICIVIMFIAFLCSYIQGNYLVGNLPVLDGTNIDWSNYKFDSIISIVLWIIVIVGTIFAIKKLTLSKVVKYFGYVSLAILVMLTLSLITSLINNSETLEKEVTPVVTFKSINNYSKDKNFIILVLDCVDSKSFYQRLSTDDDFKDIFNDFTYYPDTMGAYPYTHDSIPFIITGEYYLNEEPLQKWATKKYKDANLFKLIEDNNYELNVYEQILWYNDESVNRINNVSDSKHAENLINTKKLWKQEIKDILFRYSPFPLKKISKIESMNYDILYLQNQTGTSIDDRFYDKDNYEMLKIIRKNEVKLTDNKNFKFIHLKGAHRPWEYNKTFHKREVGTYFNEIASCLTLVKEYLEMLKNNGVYDNTAIIVMADHGCENKLSGEQRRNPIFFVKGINETNTKMKISDKMVHYSDLQEVFSDLIAGKKTKDLLPNVSTSRTRRFIGYENDDITADNLIEYESTGKAWENEKLYPTGNVYHKNW